MPYTQTTWVCDYEVTKELIQAYFKDNLDQRNFIENSQTENMSFLTKQNKEKYEFLFKQKINLRSYSGHFRIHMKTYYKK